MLAATDFDTMAQIAWAAQAELVGADDPTLALVLVRQDERHFVFGGGTGGSIGDTGRFDITGDRAFPHAHAIGRRIVSALLDDLTAGKGAEPVTVRDPLPGLEDLAPPGQYWTLIPVVFDGGPHRMLVLVSPLPIAPDLVTSSQTLMMLTALTYGGMEHRQRLQWQAWHDGLTELPNRRMLQDRLTDICSAAGIAQYALLFIDLDGFKVINDSCGHAAGDRVLTTVARRMADATREDDLVARLGGDEFAVLVRHQGRRDIVEALVARLDRVTQEPIVLSGEVTVRVGASIGVQFGADNDDPVSLLQAADAAMYLEKSARRSLPAGR
jgi:diguanylate cyclase (GGDEF)-like protein